MIVQKVLNCNGECVHIEQFVQKMNEVLKMVSPCYTNTNGVDSEHCTRIFVDGNWVKFGC